MPSTVAKVCAECSRCGPPDLARFAAIRQERRRRRVGASSMTEGLQLPRVEMSWFAALCDDDYEFLGVPDPRLLSSYEHCRDIVIAAERGGFDNILLPSGYQLGIDSIAFAGGVAPIANRIRLLAAVRCLLADVPRLVVSRLSVRARERRRRGVRPGRARSGRSSGAQARRSRLSRVSRRAAAVVGTRSPPSRIWKKVISHWSLVIGHQSAFVV